MNVNWIIFFLCRHGVVGEGVEGDEVGGGDGEDIDLPNLPEQPDNPDVDQDDLPVNAGGKWSVCESAGVSRHSPLPNLALGDILRDS